MYSSLKNRVKPIISVQNFLAQKQIGTINMNMLSVYDVANLALQRTDSLYRDRKLFKEGKGCPSFYYWSERNDDNMLLLESAIRRKKIINYVLKVILAEANVIAAKVAKYKPRILCDIGCGYGLHGLFLANKLKLDKYYALDLEQTESKHHGWAETGAGYSNLEAAKKIFEKNTKSKTKIITINPGKGAVDFPEKVDFFMSLLSCGWHYPTSAYTDMIKKYAAQESIAIFDIRRGQADNEAIFGLFKKHEIISEEPKGQRFLFSDIIL